MLYPFSSITFGNEADCYAFEKGFEGAKQLHPLSKVNIFVGANNCGKSRLMRLIAATQKLKVAPSTDNTQYALEQISAEIQNFKKQAWGTMVKYSCSSVNELEGLLDKLSVMDWITEGGDELTNQIAIISKIARETQVRSWNGGDPHSTLRVSAEEAAKTLERLPKMNSQWRVPVTQKLYIPTLRSLRDLGKEDMFGERTKLDYFHGASHVQVFSGRTLYSDIERLVRGNLGERETLRNFEIWIAETFFRGEPVALIPRIDHSTLTIKIGEEAEQPVHNLGDGIQAILTLAFPLFVRAEDDLVVLIEEPELFLHPWLQRVLIEMLSTRFPRHQYFITTHSNHLLDLTLDVGSVSVFTFEKHLEDSQHKERPARYQVSHVSGADKKPLELLGVRNSSVLLTNCTIWVEGITDRRYLAHWLKLYEKFLSENARAQLKLFKEDLHYSFVEYSGGNITHWSFLDEDGPEVERLCGKLFLIADNDGAKVGSAKAQRQQKLATKLMERFWLLPVREMENLLTPDTLREVLIGYGEDISNFNNFKQETYANQSLGRFIEKKIIKDLNSKKRRGSYAADSGTITDKLRFAELAVSAMSAFDDLSYDAKELTKQVYKFITDHNQ